MNSVHASSQPPMGGCSVPRLAFVNKLDRTGADPWKVVEQVRTKLKLRCAAVQIPIGLEGDLVGLVDLVRQRAVFFEGANGEIMREADIPANMAEAAEEKRKELVEHLSEAAVRRATLALRFIPVFMGSAFKNKARPLPPLPPLPLPSPPPLPSFCQPASRAELGLVGAGARRSLLRGRAVRVHGRGWVRQGVQLLLNGVVDYLPNPLEVENHALDQNNAEAKVPLTGSPNGAAVGLAFKLEEGRFGQLTYLRLYEGTIRRGESIINCSNGKKIKDIQEAKAGEIVALFGVDCATAAGRRPHVSGS
eukprot:jgi/Mesen1/1790/ME000014S01201